MEGGEPQKITPPQATCLSVIVANTHTHIDIQFIDAICIFIFQSFKTIDIVGSWRGIDTKILPESFSVDDA